MQTEIFTLWKFMDDTFFKGKISELSDDKLRKLLTIRYHANQRVVDIAMTEAKRRGIALPEISEHAETPEQDLEKLENWHWGAFLLAPFWTLANRLDRWFILLLIPGVNVWALIYLGMKGNKLAYEKSNIRNADDFMRLQKLWSDRGIRVFWMSVLLSIFFLLFM